MKGRVRLLQSIGRGLRLGETKSKVNIFDIADDLAVGRFKNYSLKHMAERLKIYRLSKFNVTTNKINLL